MKDPILRDKILIGSVALIVIVVILVMFLYRESEYNKNYSVLNNELNLLKTSLTEKDATLQSLQDEKSTLEEELGTTIEELENKDDEVRALDKKTKDILDLISIDEQLLQKYSKVFFLNENYIPQEISAIDKDFWVNSDKLIDVNSQIKNTLENMLEDARDDGVSIRVLSGYRSFGTQSSLKSNYTTLYGSGANAFSADQGYSEHQLGTALDFTTPEIGASLSIAFENTNAFEWLQKNAYKYGFIMSYPKGNTYYQYEPWHWRFVSKDLAKKLHKDGTNFYDMDQRDIYQYLQDFFN